MHVCKVHLQTLGLKTNSVKYKHIFNYISEFNVLHVARCNMHISCRPTLIGKILFFTLYCNHSFFIALAVVCWIMCVRNTASQGKNHSPTPVLYIS